MRSEDQLQLRHAARAATSQAFLAKDGGVRYGAAVLCADGAIYSSGQYSSYNHITNVHAEQAVLLMAAAGGNPDVITLAVASTQLDAVARPCGVCRQVMLEHATRTGRNFEVLMLGNGLPDTAYRVGDLLPDAWASHQQHGEAAEVAVRTFRLAKTMPDNAMNCRAGDYVLTRGRQMHLVWDPFLEPDGMLAKLKYSGAKGIKWRKMPHCFSQPLAYEAALMEAGLSCRLQCGALADRLRRTDVRRHYPALPWEQFHHQLPDGVVQLVKSAGLSDRVYLGGSRCIGAALSGSDWDLIVRVTPKKIPMIRKRIVREIEQGRWRIPPDSGTWRWLERYWPGGSRAIVSAQRFAETFQCEGINFAILFDTEDRSAPWYDDSWEPLGHCRLAGVVVDDRLAGCKRARYALQTEDGRRVEAAAYHKTANLLRRGDHVSVGGWLMRREHAWRLVQFSSLRDPVVWNRRVDSANELGLY